MTEEKNGDAGPGEERDEIEGARIRERAYGIWEREGRPEGRALDNWLQAKRELEPAPGSAADPRRAEVEIASLSEPG